MDKKKIEKGISEHIKDKSGHPLYTPRDFEAGVKYAEEELYTKGDMDMLVLSNKEKVAELKKKIKKKRKEGHYYLDWKELDDLINEVFGE